MPKASYIQTNFTAGELSPRLEGRVDISKYANGVQTLTNMFIYPHGGATRRGGSKYIASGKTGTKKVRLVPFQFSVEQAYVIEFGDLYCRFYRDQTQIDIGKEIATNYLEAELFELQFVQSADVLFIAHPNHPPARLSRTAVDTFSIADETFEYPPFLDENLTATTLNPSATTGSITITASAALFAATDVDRFVRIDYSGSDGYAKITGFTSDTVVNADVVKTLAGSSAVTTWRLGAFSETTGYPSSIAFFEQRLMYAGTITDPQTLWGSKSSIYNDFETGTEDDDSVKYTITSDQVNAIRWLSSGKSLTIGTVGGEFLLSASSREEAITPSNIKIVRQTEYGGAYILPVRANGVVLFVQRADKKIRQFTYQFESDTYVASDLTLLSEHITRNGFTEIDYQRTPDSVVWGVRKDGTLLGMTYERDQDVIGWHKHVLGGVSDAAGTQAQVESVAVIPAADRDELWLSVKRYVDGVETRHVEVVQEGRSNFSPVDSDDFFVDGGIQYDGVSTATISGLDHLEGETVQVLGDGAVQSDKVVSSGAITLDRAVEKASIGLQYVSDLGTMRVEAGSADGTAQGKIKRISDVIFRFYETLGALYGPNADNLDIIKFRETSNPMDAAPPRFSGDKEQAFNGDYDTEGRVFLRQSQPLPMTVLAIITRLRTNN